MKTLFYFAVLAYSIFNHDWIISALTAWLLYEQLLSEMKPAPPCAVSQSEQPLIVLS